MNRADPGTSVAEQTPCVVSMAGAAPDEPGAGHPGIPARQRDRWSWWPRTGLISRELPELVSVLDARLGGVIDINVNWSSLQRQPDLNWDWWQGTRPHIMTVGGRAAQAKLLIVPYRTGTALAVMVLRRAAGLPVYFAHRDSRAFQTAECIIRAARGERMFEVRARPASQKSSAKPI
jgi:Family of unknown function (DUF5994)